jgi:hypothetical protein
MYTDNTMKEAVCTYTENTRNIIVHICRILGMKLNICICTHCEYAAVKCTYFENTRDETVHIRRIGESTLNLNILANSKLKRKIF